jgi:Icc-related predicted phosphoesterase
MKILVLADLHYNDYNYTSYGKKHELESITDKIDGVLLCGDNAEVDHDFENHHKLFKFLRKKFSCPIGFVAGNHDIWTREIGVESEKVLYEIFPKMAKTYDISYLETQIMKMGELRFTGTYGHYDYSFFLPNAEVKMADVKKSKVILPGMRLTYNDKSKMQLEKSDQKLSSQLIESFEKRLKNQDLKKMITISHTIPDLALVGRAVNDSRSVFLSAYSGSVKLKKVLERYPPAYHFCGHTHLPAEMKIGQTHAINVGSDYKLLRYGILNTKSGQTSFKDKLIEELPVIETYSL